MPPRGQGRSHYAEKDLMSPVPPRWFHPVALVGLAALVLSGCQQDEEIRRYQVPKPPTFPEPPAKVRMLAAILPHGERTWFFKLTGPAAVVGQQAEAFDRFIQSVRFTDDKDKPVDWTAPEGWEKVPNRSNSLALATFRVGPKDDPAELTVSAAGGSLLANVNRWRGQIGLKPIAENGLDKVTKPLDVNGVKGTRVDLSGPGGKGGGMGR